MSSLFFLGENLHGLFGKIGKIGEIGEIGEIGRLNRFKDLVVERESETGLYL